MAQKEQFSQEPQEGCRVRRLAASARDDPALDFKGRKLVGQRQFGCAYIGLKPIAHVPVTRCHWFRAEPLAMGLKMVMCCWRERSMQRRVDRF